MTPANLTPALGPEIKPQLSFLHSLALAQDDIFPPPNTSPAEICWRRKSSPATKSPRGWKHGCELCQPATCTNCWKEWQPFEKPTFEHGPAPTTPSPAASFLPLNQQHHPPWPWTLLLLHICCLQIFLSPPPFLNTKSLTASPFHQATTASCHRGWWSLLFMDLPQLPTAPTSPVQFPSFSPHVVCVEMRASPILVGAGMQLQLHQQLEIPEAVGWSLVQCWWDPGSPAPWFLWSKTGLACKTLSPPHCFQDPVQKNVLDFLLISLIPSPVSSSSVMIVNTLLVQDPSIVSKATRSSSHLLLLSLWISKCIWCSFNQNFM